MRIQFYPSSDLEQKLNNEAMKFGVNVSTLVNDLLNKHYGLIPATSISNSELERKIFEEIAAFVNDPSNVGEEFDLNKASETYRNIDTVCAGKPSAIKAQIGKKFNNKLVGVTPYASVHQVKINNKPKLTVFNRAAIYVICKEESTDD